MAKLVIVVVPAEGGIPEHTVQMRPDEAARFWELQEAKFRANQEKLAASRHLRHELPPGSGAVLTGPCASMQTALGAMGIPTLQGLGEAIPFERTLLWNPAAPLRLELLPAGLRLLDRWQVLAPVHSYTELARDIGGDQEREYTERVIRDLRVPVYDPRVLLLRMCPEAEQLLIAWKEERMNGHDDRLCFVRALYRIKPLINPLPAGVWINAKQ